MQLVKTLLILGLSNEVIVQQVELQQKLDCLCRHPKEFSLISYTNIFKESVFFLFIRKDSYTQKRLWFSRCFVDVTNIFA